MSFCFWQTDVVIFDNIDIFVMLKKQFWLACISLYFNIYGTSEHWSYWFNLLLVHVQPDSMKFIFCKCHYVKPKGLT